MASTHLRDAGQQGRDADDAKVIGRNPFSSSITAAVLR